MFGKIHTDIFNSSLIAEGGWLPTYVFICMVTLSDKDGNLPVDPRVLYRQIGFDTGEQISREAFLEAIEFLSSEDRNSNLTAQSGRRIIPLSELDDVEDNRGFRVVNKAHYRDKGSIEQRLENDRERKRRQRAKEKAEKEAAQADDQDTAPAEPERGDPPKLQPKPKRKSKRFAEFWEAYPGDRRVNRDECEQIWASKNLDENADKVIADVNNRRENDPQWQQEGGRFIPGSVKYLESDRWEDTAGATGPKKGPPKAHTYLAVTNSCVVWIPAEILARATDEERDEYERNKALNLKIGHKEPDWNSPKNRAITREWIESLDSGRRSQTSTADEA